jgi:hypothetical protein
MQYGFPFVFITRSVPTTACSWSGQSSTTDVEVHDYSTHHIMPLALLGNVVVWGIFALLIVKLLTRQMPHVKE